MRPFEPRFPRFAAFLQSGAAEPIDEISLPATESEINQDEQSISVPLPASYTDFLRIARCISIQGGSFRMGPEHPFVHEFPSIDELPHPHRTRVIQSGKPWPPPSQGMVCVADFWLDGDGDQVLFNVSGGLTDGEYAVYYYNHDEATVRRLADDFGQFVENVLAR